MDALYSLKSRGDSFESFVASEQTEEDEYELDFESESEQEDEWEDLGRDDSNSSSCSGGGQNEEDASVTIKPHVQVHQQYFKADATAADRIEERDNSGTGVTADDEPESEPEFERAFEASALIDEPQYLLISAASVATTSGVDRRTQSRLQSALSPSSKSRNAKEVLRSFYLLKAKQTEATRRLIVVHPPPQISPAPQNVILPLKAPVRYPVAVQEEVIQTENAQKAKLALQQFYLARELAKQKRAALNRSNEAQLIQSQSGRGVLLGSNAPSDQAPAWDSMQRILAR